DVVGGHLVAGRCGTVALGFLATGSGLFCGGGLSQLIVQVLIAVAAIVSSAVITVVIALPLKAVMGWRIEEDVEVAGIDQGIHAESAYDFTGGSGRLVGVGVTSREALPGASDAAATTDNSKEARA